MATESKTIECDGWWQQPGLGRQAMLELRLGFDVGTVSGSGHDIIGIFTFRGTVSEDGRIAMVKQYLGQHSVDYVGSYDGEGTLFGQWRIGAWGDRWLIKFKRSPARSQQLAIAEIA